MSNRSLSDRAWFDEHVKIITVDVPPPVPRCDCTNPLTADDIERGDGLCEWCLYADDECQILVEVKGIASGEQIGTCVADGRPIFRSRIAGTIYHASEDR